VEKTKVNYSVVLIDDSLSECKKISNILIGEGFDVTYFDNAFLGIECIIRNVPDIIISDIVMPDMNGYEVCQYVKNQESIAHIPILLLSGLETADALERGYEAGAFDFVNKADHSSILISRAKSCIEYHKVLEKQKEQNRLLEEMIEQKTKLLIKAERQCIFAQFIQGIVQNLKNPLGAISGFSEINRHYLDIVGTKINDKTIDTIKNNNELIYQSTENIFSLIRSLLKKGKESLSEQVESVNLNELIEKELAFFESNIFFNQKVKRSLHIPQEELIINIVPSIITQIFQNIISNAVDALLHTEEPTIDIFTGKDNEYCWFEVVDNGAGIDEENMEKIYDPFFTTKHVSQPAHQSYSGTGMGLFICKELTESVKGHIKVSSKKGEFTSFKVLLPFNSAT